MATHVKNIITKLNPSVGEIKLGEWNVHFSDGLKYAEDNNIPIYVFWSNNGCRTCDTVINNFNSSFIDGAKELKIVLIGICNFNSGEYQSDSLAAKSWIGSGNYPLSKIYWKKANGTVVQRKWDNYDTPSKSGSDMSSRFLNSIKECIEGYVPPVDKFTVTFKDWNGSIIQTKIVDKGMSAIPPADPTRDGYEFTGWSAQFENIQQDTICIAQYKKSIQPQPSLTVAHTIKMSDNIDNLQVIGDSEFPNALQSSLISVEIGSNCTSIGPSCFINCKNLEYVKMPKTCRYIGDYAFYGCENLKYITCLDENDSYEIFSYGAHAFEGCNSLEHISFKLSSTVSRDATVGNCCFANCSSLKSFSQKGWSYLGSYMLSGCESLTSITLQNNTNYVQDYALAGIPNIKDITIPNKIWIISEGMFAGDRSLTSVSISDGKNKDNKSVMMMIGDSAFASCDNLTSITLPKSINDISCCGDFMLKDSNISVVTFNGLTDSKFVTTSGKKINLIDGYIQDKTEFNAASELAIKNNVPMIIFTNKTSIDGNAGGCSFCKRLMTQLRTDKWKKFMKQNKDKCLFIYAVGWDSVFETEFTSKKIKIPWNPPLSQHNYYAKVACVWYKKDGKTSMIHDNGYSWGEYDDPSVLIDNVTKFIVDAKPTGAKEILNEKVIKQTLDKFGSSLAQVRFVSKEGNSYVVTKDTHVDPIPNVRVDVRTKDFFRYGTWYYNAEELRSYADKNGIPVLCEYSKDGCSPCMYFKKNVFKNKTFQNWVMSRPYLFCRIEIGEGENENFDNKFANPEAYYIDKVWAKEIDPEVTKKSIPIFFWYWNQNGVRKVGDLSSYHFNPDVEGAKPPFSMEDIMNQTDSKFRTYLSSDEFKRYETYDLYSNAAQPAKIGMYANNIAGDTEGIMFPCDYKEEVDRYDIALSLSGYQTIANGIAVGQTVPFKPYTYYVYSPDAAQSYYPDARGVIFKVEISNDLCVVTHVIDAQNDTDTKYKERTYKTNSWYNLTADNDAATFNGIIDEADNRDSKVVILKTSNEEQFNNIANTSSFKALFDELALTYFIEVRSTNWSIGIGEAFKNFQTADHNQKQDAVHFPSWEEKTPLVFTYMRCINCTSDGKNATPEVAAQIDPARLEPADIANKVKDSFQNAI